MVLQGETISLLLKFHGKSFYLKCYVYSKILFKPAGYLKKQREPEWCPALKFMARLKGFEPPTYGLEVRCSIQLSYRRITCIYNIGDSCCLFIFHQKTEYFFTHAPNFYMVTDRKTQKHLTEYDSAYLQI